MAHSSITFRHPVFGTTKVAPVGFSWTTFFFGFFPALLRGDFKWGGIILVTTVGVSVLTLGVGGLICGVVFAAFYNKLYIKDLSDAGFKVKDFTSLYDLQQLQAQLEVVLEPEAQTN
jgi:hypothetical protein